MCQYLLQNVALLLGYFVYETISSLTDSISMLYFNLLFLSNCIWLDLLDISNSLVQPALFTLVLNRTATTITNEKSDSKLSLKSSRTKERIQLTPKVAKPMFEYWSRFQLCQDGMKDVALCDANNIHKFKPRIRQHNIISMILLDGDIYGFTHHITWAIIDIHSHCNVTHYWNHRNPYMVMARKSVVRLFTPDIVCVFWNVLHTDCWWLERMAFNSSHYINCFVN